MKSTPIEDDLQYIRLFWESLCLTLNSQQWINTSTTLLIRVETNNPDWYRYIQQFTSVPSPCSTFWRISDAIQSLCNYSLLRRFKFSTSDSVVLRRRQNVSKSLINQEILEEKYMRWFIARLKRTICSR